jgi:DNA-binding NtrC family response regulator
MRRPGRVERLMIWRPADGDRSGCRRLLPVSTRAGRANVAVAPHTFETFKQEAEKNFLLQKLRDHDLNVSETARTLRMPRSNLYKKIERYGLRRESA